MSSQPGCSREAAQHRARASGRSPGSRLEHDPAALPSRTEERRVDAGRDDPEVAGEALRRLGGDHRRGGDQRVDPRQQPVALGLSRRIGQPVGREERRDRERAGIAQSQVRQARDAGLEAMDDVEAEPAERVAETAARIPTGIPTLLPGATVTVGVDRDHVRLGSVQQGAAAGGEIARAARRREDGDAVPELAQFRGDAGDVLVYIVRLRPREGRDQADAEEPSVVTLAL